MYNFKLNDPHFLPHIGCEIELSLGKGEGIVLMGHNGMGKTTLMRRIFEDRASNISMSYIQQQQMDFFFNRSIGQMKSILLNARKQLVDLDLFNRCWEMFGLIEKEDRRTDALSGGEAQILKISFGLARRADLFLIDEPTQSLDAHRKAVLKELLMDLRKRGAAVLVIEHDPSWLGEDWTVQALAIENQTLVKGDSWTT